MINPPQLTPNNQWCLDQLHITDMEVTRRIQSHYGELDRLPTLLVTRRDIRLKAVSLRAHAKKDMVAWGINH